MEDCTHWQRVKAIPSFKKNIGLFIWLHIILVVACRISVGAHGL